MPTNNTKDTKTKENIEIDNAWQERMHPLFPCIIFDLPEESTKNAEKKIFGWQACYVSITLNNTCMSLRRTPQSSPKKNLEGRLFIRLRIPA